MSVILAPLLPQTLAEHGFPPVSAMRIIENAANGADTFAEIRRNSISRGEVVMPNGGSCGEQILGLVQKKVPSHCAAKQQKL